MVPENIFNALIDLNDFTEHQFGLGPLEDDYRAGTPARGKIRKALAVLSRWDKDKAKRLRSILL